MRRLILMRHAKSAWDVPGQPDIERSLNDRGRRAAPSMGAYLAREGLRPDRVIVSAATRTRETWALVADQLGGTPEVIVEPRIYEAPPQILLGLVRETLEAAPTLMLVGHNPGLQMLALHLARRDNTPSRRRLIDKFPTAAVAVLDTLIEDWADLMPDTCVLQRFVTPALVGAMDADD